MDGGIANWRQAASIKERVSQGEPKLMDFGIAKIDAAELTAPGDFLGTPSYMSPEQALGAQIDGRSDLFSLGAVLYLALTGRRAFDAPSVPGVMARVVNEPPAPLGVPALPAGVEYIVERCLAKAPVSRYARARHLEEDIEDVLSGRPPRHREGWAAAPPAAAPVPRPAAASIGDVVIRWVDRLGWRALAAIGTGLLLITAGAALLRRPTAPPAASAVVAQPNLAPARLELSFRHPFRMGTVRVWIDDVLVLEEAVPGRVTRDLLAIRLRRGTFKAVLDVPPGEHVVRVQVDDGGGFRESRRMRGTFAGGEVRRLDAAVDGVLQKDLALVWGP